MIQIAIGFRFLLLMTFLLGVLYPVATTGVSQVLFPFEASGAFVKRGDKVIGSLRIAQKFERPTYFWARPSAIQYNPLPSGGSNYSQTSSDLKNTVEERRKLLKRMHPDQFIDPPQDLLFASASGLDPDISPEAARYQLERVAKARNWSTETILALIYRATKSRQWGFLGEPVVNVFELNLLLDEANSIE